MELEELASMRGLLEGPVPTEHAARQERRQVRQVLMQEGLRAVRAASTSEQKLQICALLAATPGLAESDAQRVDALRVAALADAGRLEEATAGLERLPPAVQARPSAALIRAFCRADQPVQATSWLARLQQADAGALELSCLLEIADAWLRRPDAERALLTLKEAVKRAASPLERGRVLLLQGRGLRMQGQTERARDCLLAARESLVPKQKAVVIGGVSLRMAGDTEGGGPPKRPEDPWLQWTLFELGSLALERLDWTEARTFLRECCDKSSRQRHRRCNRAAAEALAEGCLLHGDVQEGVSYLERALKQAERLGERSPTTLWELGARLYDAAGNPAKAASFRIRLPD